MATIPYTIPPDTVIGHVHLKVSDIDKAVEFYCGLLGFEITARYGAEAAFISAGGYHHHIGLNVWFSKNGPSPPRNATGLFHTAIRYPSEKDLALIYQRLKEARYALSGASDHGVSKAIYLDDPDGNGVELYWDRPADQWPRNKAGELEMYTRPLDINELLSTLT